ncbi:MAG: helix-turn-helix transcriptional regulator [Candidatus Promineifilaceae bacterium]
MERELLLLGLLRRQDMHGYQLHEFIEQNLDTCVELKKSTAYYLLDKLADEGLVGENGERVGNRPQRRVYHLTAEGEARFQELLRLNLASYIPARFGGMVGLAFLDDIGSQEARDLLRERRQKLAQALVEAQNVPIHHGSQQLVIDHQVAHLNAELAWLDALIEEIDIAENSL